MEYHCGNCGASLDEAALDNGTCPVCGAKISPFGDVIDSTSRRPIVPDADASWPTAVLQPPAEAAPVSGPLYTKGPLDNTHTRLEAIRTMRETGRLADLPVGSDPLRHVPRPALLAGIGVALALVLLCTVTMTGVLLHSVTIGAAAPVPTQTHKRTTPAPTQPVGLGFPTQNPDPTPLPFQGSLPTPVPTSTPFGGAPTPTPKPTPSPTQPSMMPTPGTGTSQLQVTPQNVSYRCPSAPHDFLVGNTGTGILNWT